MSINIKNITNTDCLVMYNNSDYIRTYIKDARENEDGSFYFGNNWGYFNKDGFSIKDDGSADGNFYIYEVLKDFMLETGDIDISVLKPNDIIIGCDKEDFTGMVKSIIKDGLFYKVEVKFSGCNSVWTEWYNRAGKCVNSITSDSIVGYSDIKELQIK